MNRTGIEWADYTWNPIVGCTRGCDYCYARRFARRHVHQCHLCGTFTPHLHPERLDQPAEVRRPSIVFCASIADIWDREVQTEWRHRVFEAMCAALHHHYVVLTKVPHGIAYAELVSKCVPLMKAGEWGHLWIGVSISGRYKDTEQRRIDCLYSLHRDTGVPTVLSVEPLLAPIPSYHEPGYHIIWDTIKWLIVGAQTGPGATMPTATWVTDLVQRAEDAGVPVFVKDNLRGCVGNEYVEAHQQWPVVMRNETRGRAAQSRSNKGDS